jgi:cytochrome c biogenesis protein CcmG, thiol:disulfide interchange protein DsbE
MTDVSNTVSDSAAARASTSTITKIWRYFLPLAIFFGLVWFLYKGLSLNPREVPSALINKPAPEFRLALLHDDQKNLSPADMKGQVWLMNVWGSWCVSCQYEHPVLNELAKQQVVPIIGFNWKDEPDNAKKWLKKYGDPYAKSVMDRDGRVAIDYGVYGAPETFVIDKAGMIRLKHTGPISPEDMQKKIVPLLQELKKA